MKKNIGLLLIILLSVTQLSYAQEKDSVKNPGHFSGKVSITNKSVVVDLQ